MRINFKKQVTYLSLVFPLLLITCQKNPSGPQGIRDYYPLAVGNFWFYGVEGNTYPIWSQIKEEIIGYDNSSNLGLSFVKRRIFDYRRSDGTYGTFSFSDTTFTYLKVIRGELREYYNKSCTLDYKILLEAPLQIGTKWNIYPDSICPGPHPDNEPVDVISIETITVPAGTFNDCYRIRICGCPDNTEYYWFSSNVGIVKFSLIDLGGTTTYSLKKYYVR